MRIGYARAATTDQKAPSPRTHLPGPAARTWLEMRRGIRVERLGLTTPCARLRLDASRVVWPLDRLRRSPQDLVFPRQHPGAVVTAARQATTQPHLAGAQSARQQDAEDTPSDDVSTAVGGGFLSWRV